MSTWQLYSKREKAKENAGKEDIYQYTTLPEAFRNQVIHIWIQAIGTWDTPQPFMPYSDPFANKIWTKIFQYMTEEKGVFQLHPHGGNPTIQCFEYIKNTGTDNCIDIIECSFRFISTFVGQLSDYDLRIHNLIKPDDAIAKLNYRFREHGIGYEFSGGEIIRFDSKYLHAEAVRPALGLLHEAGIGFSGALQEFLDAHERHRKRENKDAIVSACKAFESTMKAICIARKWPFDSKKDTAAKLVDIVLTNELIPTYLQSHVSALRTILESGVPTVRNKTSGHGQGATPIEVADHYVSYVLHLTATNILFLIESHKAMI